MKKLLFLFVVFPFFAFAQNQVTLKSGLRFDCNIIGIWGTRLTFDDIVKELNTDKVEISSVASIAGKIQKSTLNAIVKKNPEVILNAEFVKTPNHLPTPPADADNSFQPYTQGNQYNHQLTAGDYIERAGNRYLGGLCLSLGGGIVAFVGTNKGIDELSTVGSIMVLTGGVIAITGHFQLIKAGRKMNSDAVTIGPASQGIGLAINF